MQQRSVAAGGRPSGTDGFDFSYRMVVDSRYTRVAKGRSTLGALLALQAVDQIIWTLVVLLSASRQKKLEIFPAISVSVGFISLVIGELGRRRSNAKLLKFYTIISSIATSLAVAGIIKSDLFLKVSQQRRVSVITNYELLEFGRALIGIVLQVIIVSTTITLVRNMTPKKVS